MQKRRSSRSSSGVAASNERSAPEVVHTPSSNQEAIEALASEQGADEEESWLHNFGESFGLGAGILVTDILDMVPGWNEALLDENGKPVQEIDGTERIGDLDLEKRHRKVVGAQIAAYADGLDDGWWKDFVSGVGEGATEGPGESYRREAADD